MYARAYANLQHDLRRAERALSYQAESRLAERQ
jgi:hypothetical protein